MLSDQICDYVDQIDQLDTAYDVFKYTRKLGNQFGADRFSIVALDDARVTMPTSRSSTTGIPNC